MTYKHKLARRLAVLRRGGWAALGIASAACSAGESTGPGAPDLTGPAVAAVRIRPRRLILETNQPARFQASAQDSLGDSLAIDLEWLATGGTIDAEGSFRAAQVGEFKVVGRGRTKNHPADTADVIVVPPAPTLARVIVTPDTASLAPGAVQAFTAKGKLSDSTVVDIGVNWTATGGTVDAAGSYTAGATAGTFRVVATNTAGTLADTAVVTIGAPAPAPPPPPAAGSSTIDLKIHRLDGGSGTTLVSNAIPLARGALAAGALRNVRVLVNGQEQSVYIEALQGTHLDGSVRSVLVQFKTSVAAGSPVAAQLQLGTARSTADLAKTAVTWALPSAAALPTSPDYLITTDLTSPTMTSAQTEQVSSAWADYEAKFRQYADYQWTQTGAAWSGNYYDRALIYFTFWARTGNPVYWERGARMAVDYRDKYLVANGYGASPHWSQLEGQAAHYWLTGDERSRTAVIETAKRLTDAYTVSKMGDPTFSWTEGRIQARMLMASLVSWQLKDTQRNWGALADGYTNNAISLQKADGSYNWMICSLTECPTGTVWGTSNFMLGLQNDALIKYYRLKNADPRIVTTIRKSVDWLWATQWRSDAQAFQYWSIKSTNPAVDLNQLISPSFAFVYQQTQVASYRTNGDAIFAAGVRGAYYQGSKQFNEQYYTSAQNTMLRK